MQKLVEILLIPLIQVALERFVNLLELVLMTESLLLLVPHMLLALVVKMHMLADEVIVEHILVVLYFSSVFETG